MSIKKTTPERLTAFSDGVFAVIITIMVLNLRPPDAAALSAILPLWPAVLSYAVSYLFIAIIWVNHHHLFRFTDEATPQLIWWNFAHLFMISFVPAATAWMAKTRLAAGPVFLYALIFVLVDIAFIAFERTAFSQTRDADLSPQQKRSAKLRSYLALGMFSSAAAISFWSPQAGLGLVCCVLLIYLNPRLPDRCIDWLANKRRSRL
jgi:uncharacterized membrane protein